MLGNRRTQSIRPQRSFQVGPKCLSRCQANARPAGRVAAHRKGVSSIRTDGCEARRSTLTVADALDVGGDREVPKCQAGTERARSHPTGSQPAPQPRRSRRASGIGSGRRWGAMGAHGSAVGDGGRSMGAASRTRCRAGPRTLGGGLLLVGVLIALRPRRTVVAPATAGKVAVPTSWRSRKLRMRAHISPGCATTRSQRASRAAPHEKTGCASSPGQLAMAAS